MHQHCDHLRPLRGVSARSNMSAAPWVDETTETIDISWYFDLRIRCPQNWMNRIFRKQHGNNITWILRMFHPYFDMFDPYSPCRFQKRKHIFLMDGQTDSLSNFVSGPDFPCLAHVRDQMPRRMMFMSFFQVHYGRIYVCHGCLSSIAAYTRSRGRLLS